MEESISNFNLEQLETDNKIIEMPYIAYAEEGLDNVGAIGTVYVGRINKILKRFPASRQTEEMDYELFRYLAGGGYASGITGRTPQEVKEALIKKDGRFAEKRFIHLK